MRNKLGLIGLLGFLGFLGYLTNNPGFYGFFGFYGWFGFLRMKDDEMLRQNLREAGWNAFLVGLILYPFFVIWGAFGNTALAFSFGFAVSFAIQILVFSFRLTYLENRGLKE